MKLFGFTDFSKETRTKFRDCIYDRMDTVFMNWVYGEYNDTDLEYVFDEDPETNELCRMFEILYCNFVPGPSYEHVSKYHWLADRACLTDFPSRQTFYHYKPNELKMEVKFKRARTFSMHGPDGEVQCVPCGVARPVVDTPRRSTRVKYPREIYYVY